MRKILGYILFTLVAVSCSTKKDTFRLEGTFKGFNQGELYIYELNGSHQLDTISVSKGEFRYEIPLDAPATFVLVFPNFSELPVFGTSGTKVEITADASHLKETKIKGTKENEQMTAFRLKTREQTQPEVAQAATQYIKENATSPVAFYLFQKYFLQVPNPDYQKVGELAETLRRANPNRSDIAVLIRQLPGLKSLKVKGKLPSFTGTDIQGRSVSSADLNAPANIVSVWATWNYESHNVQRQLHSMQTRFGSDRLKIISICMDAGVKTCQDWVKRDSIPWSNICDGKMWESPIIQKTGLSYVPDVIITDSQGTIVLRMRSTQEIVRQIEEMLIKTD